jgi:hypothetical protein
LVGAGLFMFAPATSRSGRGRCRVGAAIDSAAPRLYFLHIPKTAGSSVTRLLEDAWPAGAVAPHRFVNDLGQGGADELSRFDVVSGHLGTVAATDDRQVVTLLRDPVRRAWSHYRGHRWRADPSQRIESFGALLDHPVHGWLARDYQARWLAFPPVRAELSRLALPHGTPGHEGGATPGVADNELEARAVAFLRRCALVGTVERIDDFVRALARLVQRPMPMPPRVNVGDGEEDVPREEAAMVRGRSRIDARLHVLAEAELDNALAILPRLPPEREVALPYRMTMGDGICGTGWHPRVRTPQAGWHRWTGPGLRSELRLPVRAAGLAVLEVAIVSACDDDAVRSLRVSVQGRMADHRLENRGVGVSAVCDVELDPSRPLMIELEISHTRVLVKPAGDEVSDPAGLAIGDVALDARSSAAR